jgi:hypothetical protein
LGGMVAVSPLHKQSFHLEAGNSRSGNIGYFLSYDLTLKN